MPLMLLVVALFTITSLNDKYAVSKCHLNGSELTFLMAAGTSVFLTFLLPFMDTKFTLCPQAFLCIGLIALSKYLEFAMSAKILIDMSAFELKAWMGVVIFLSYITDVIMGSELKLLKLLMIAVTGAGLVFIALSGRSSVNYKKILIPLILYLAASFGYGFVMKAAEPYISSTMTIYFALIILALVLIPSAKPAKIISNCAEGKKGVGFVVLAKLPNAFGLLGYNAVAAQSLTNYSFISPMVLIVLFIIGLIRKDGEKPDKLNLTGSLLCIAGIVGFQFV
ncbi:MAG: hypothetical protein ACI4KF_03810 [Huintestinicola sp.]